LPPLNRLTVTVNRKLFPFAIVLLLAGLAPATAIIGFCARMPCCGHEAAASLAMSTDRADCCTTIACYESPSATLSTTAVAPLSLLAMPALLSNAPVLPTAARSAPPTPIDTSPPLPTRDRLAVLSTLLI
jgi:hypothetical protein